MIKQIEYKGMIYTKYFKGIKVNSIIAKRFVRRIKSMSRCIKCGESRPWCLHYHHRNRKDKFMSIHDMANKGFPIILIKEEIRKCDCLCANDHSEIHYRRFWIRI